MEKEIKDIFNEQVLKAAANSFGVDSAALTLIGGFQNFIYEYEKENKIYILRLTHSSHRKEEQVRGELEWVLYLVDNGVSASKPVYSLQGNLTERIIVKDSYFIVTSFEKAIGKKVVYPECISNDELFEKCGEITGKIHCLSKQYFPSRKEIERHQWTDNYYLQNIDKFIPADQYKVHESCKAIIDKISKLGKDENSYGLIHGDINVYNFLVGDKGINIFDFDECQYSWFVEDIAIQLYYITYVFLDDSIDERQEEADRFMENFMRGYSRENSMDEYWLKQIPLFLQLREIIVYIGAYRSFDFENLNQWRKNYLVDTRRRIEERVSLVNIIG